MGRFIPGIACAMAAVLAGCLVDGQPAPELLPPAAPPPAPPAAPAEQADPAQDAESVEVTIRVVDPYAKPMAGVQVQALPADICVGNNVAISNAEGLATFRIAGSPWEQVNAHLKRKDGSPKPRFRSTLPDDIGVLLLFQADKFQPGKGRDLAGDDPALYAYYGTVYEKLKADKYPSLMIRRRVKRRLRITDVSGHPVEPMPVHIGYAAGPEDDQRLYALLGIEPALEELELGEDGVLNLLVPPAASRINVLPRDRSWFGDDIEPIPPSGDLAVQFLKAVELRIHCEWAPGIPKAARPGRLTWILKDSSDPARSWNTVSEKRVRGARVYVPEIAFRAELWLDDKFKASFEWEPGQDTRIRVRVESIADLHPVRVRVLNRDGTRMSLRYSMLHLSAEHETKRLRQFESLSTLEPRDEMVLHLPAGLYTTVVVERPGMMPGMETEQSTALHNVRVPADEPWEFTFPRPEEKK